MNDIPRRVFDVWQAPLTIKDCAGLMKKIKLECSKCDKTFVNEQRFANHIEKCLRNAEHDTNFQLHMHANRLLILQHRVAMFCGTSDQEELLECGLCKAEFETEDEVRTHLRRCANYKKEYQKFMTAYSQIFTTMLHSYEELGHLFQHFVLDRHILQIKEATSQQNDIYFDDLSDHFVEKYQEYIFVISNFIDDAFNRWLVKREKDDRNEKLEQIRRQLLESEGTSEDDLFGSDSDLGNEEDVAMESDEEVSESEESESDDDSEEDEDIAESSEDEEELSEYQDEEEEQEEEFIEEDVEVYEVIDFDDQEYFINEEIIEDDADEDRIIDVIM